MLSGVSMQNPKKLTRKTSSTTMTASSQSNITNYLVVIDSRFAKRLQQSLTPHWGFHSISPIIPFAPFVPVQHRKWFPLMQPQSSQPEFSGLYTQILPAPRFLRHLFWHPWGLGQPERVESDVFQKTSLSFNMENNNSKVIYTYIYNHPAVGELVGVVSLQFETHDSNYKCWSIRIAIESKATTNWGREICIIYT